MKIVSAKVIAPKSSSGFGGVPVFCRIDTDEGIYGYGEAQLSVGVGSGAVFQAICDLLPMAMGMDPLHNEVIWEKLRRGSFWGVANGIILMSAISAIDIALWDIKGRLCGLPLYQLLGGKSHEKLRCYASQAHFGWGIDREKPDCPVTGSEEWYKQITRNVEAEGYSAMKVGVLMHNAEGSAAGYARTTNYLDREMQKLAEMRLAAIREVSPQIDIILENHATTDAAVTIQLAKIAEKYDIMMIEEATPPLNPDVMKRIADSTSIPIVSGEHTVTRWGFLPFLENGSLSMLQPDVGICGGITEMKKICDMAHAYDVSIQAHVYSSQISYVASLHLETAIPNFCIHEHHISSAGAYMLELGDWSVLPKDGFISAPDVPGIGVDLSEKALSEANIKEVHPS